jgi:peroxiredoxin
VLIAFGDAEANRRVARAHRLECPVLLSDGAPVEAFGAIGTPAAYLVDEEGRVASPRALGFEEVPALARQAAGRTGVVRLRSLNASRIRRDGLPAGSVAPDFRLRAVNGGDVSLGDHRGRRVLLVFTHPHCPPCDELAPQLALMVGRGEADENRRKCEEHGIEFPAVVQRGTKPSRAYGIFSWPVAFLVDEHGVIAEKVAIGTEAILALAHRGARAGEEAPMEV